MSNSASNPQWTSRRSTANRRYAPRPLWIKSRPRQRRPQMSALGHKRSPHVCSGLIFGAPTTQKKNLARPALCPGLLLDVGKFNAMTLHKQPYGYSDNQERDQVNPQRLKCLHGLLRHENKHGNRVSQIWTPSAECFRYSSFCAPFHVRITPSVDRAVMSALGEKQISGLSDPCPLQA